MKILLLLRHAKSSWADPGMTDHDRPLNERGKREAPLVGAALAQRPCLPDLLLCSSAKRARKTAKKVYEAAHLDCELKPLTELYLATPAGYVAALRALSAELHCVLVVGHNPGLEDLLESLTGSQQSMQTATIAEVELPIDSWSNLRTDTPGRLTWLWRPLATPESH